MTSLKAHIEMKRNFSQTVLHALTKIVWKIDENKKKSTNFEKPSNIDTFSRTNTLL